MEIDQTASDTQEQLRQTIKKLYCQLTQGCGNVDCKNRYCAIGASKRKWNPDEAIVESLKLAKSNDNSYFCPPIEFISLSSTIELLEQLKNGNPSLLVRKIGSTFSNSSCLNASFLKSNILPDDTNFGVDLESVWSFFDLIKDHQNIVDVLNNALERLLTQTKISAVALQLTTKEQLRQFIIILQYPRLRDESNYKPLLFNLCQTLNTLPKSAQNFLVSHLVGLEKNRFLTLIRILQEYISIRALISNVESLNTDGALVAATKTLSLLNEANERSRVVSYTEFYNNVINENVGTEEGLDENLHNWKKKSGFSFCNYPFLLDPPLKNRLLQYENATKMEESKKDIFVQLLRGNFNSVPSFRLVLPVERSHLIQSSVNQLHQVPKQSLKKQLRVVFVGEEGIDEGGVQKEWFHLILREIFDPNFGMFTHTADSKYYWFNPNSTDYEEFELIGKLLGLAIYNSVILEVKFPPILYKKLLGFEGSLGDLKDIQNELAAGLEKLLQFDGNVEETFGATFRITYDYFGEKRFHDLKSKGDDVSVTNENRQEFVLLYTRYLLEESVKKQYDAFFKGFSMVCDGGVFKLLRPEELELLICGSPSLDFEELERHTTYESGYSKDHPLIKDFWDVVHHMTLEQKKRLLFFSTGSDRAPVEGLKGLNLVIARHGGDSDRLPSAHTCFNHLLLPEYSSKSKLKDRLLAAINNAEGFGML